MMFFDSFKWVARVAAAGVGGGVVFAGGGGGLMCWRRRLVAALVVAVLAVGLAPVGVLAPAPAEAQTAPGKPTGLSASPGFKSVTLSWNNPSNSNITQYQFQQRIAGSSWGSVWDPIPGSGANSTSYVVAGLTNDVTYDFRIRAVAGVRNSAASDVVSATPFDSPAAPSNLVASAGDGRVALSWDNPFNSNIVGYLFRYASGTLSSSDAWRSVVGSDASTTSHLVTGLTNGTQYTFQIRPSGRNFVRGLESVMVTATPEAGLVLAPYGFGLAGYGSNSLTVSWDDPSNNAITGYQYRIGSGVPYSWGNWTEINNSSASTVTAAFSSLTSGVRYGVQVRAVLGTKLSPPSREVYGYPVAGVSGLAARRGDTRVTLEWTRVNNVGVTGFEYQIIEGQTSGEWTAVPDSDGTTRSFTVLGLTNGTAYKFKVRTTQDGFSAGAAEVGPVTPAAGTTAIPAVPTNFRVTRWFNTGFEVQWDEPDNAAVTGYQYRTSRTSDPEGGWYGWAVIPGGKKTTTFQRSSGFANKTAVYIQIRAVVGSTPGIASRPVLIVPNAPVVLSPNAGDKQVTLSWPDPENSYIVGWEYSALQSSGTINLASGWTLIPNSDATTTSHTVDNVNGTLLNDVTFYQFRVRPVFGAGLTGALSNTVQAVPTAARKAKPAAPRNFRVTSFTYDTSTSKLDAVFSSADLSNPNITNYKWTLRRVSAENPHVNHTSTGRTLRIAQIDADIAHEACVRAAIKISEGNFVDGFPSCIRFTPYSPPSGLTTQASTSQVKLSWTDPNVDAIAWYQYRVGTGEIGSIKWQDWNGVPNSNADTTTHTVGGLTTGTQYRFQLRAGVTGQPPTPPSTIVTATPLLPDPPAKLANVSVTVGNQSVTLGWDNPNSDVVDGYEYRQGTGDPLSWGEWTAFSGRFIALGGKIQRVVVGLTNGTTYSFQVRATAGTVKGVASDTVTATPVAPPAKPTGLSATAGVLQVTLSWSDPSNSNITHYEFRQRVTGSNTWDSWTEISNSDADTTSHTVSGLTGGTAYDFQIQALAGIAVGTRSDVVSATPLLPDPPAKLANVSVTVGNQSVTLSWDNPNSDVVDGYEYRQGTGDPLSWGEWTAFSGRFIALGGKIQRVVVGLTNGTTYSFQVRATAGTVKGVASDTVTATPVAPPAKPTGLSATAGVLQVTLSWSDPSNSNITHYEFRQRVTGSNTWDSWTEISNSDADTTSHTVTGLTGGTTYDFQIQALAGIAVGTRSDVVSATTLLPDPPAKLANVRVKPAPTRVTVFFDEPSNSAITGYQYRQRVGTSGVWSGWNNVAEADRGIGQIFIASLTNGVTYDFQVRAVIGNVKGVASDVVSGTPFPPPAKPTGLSATGGVNQVTLSWSDPSNSNITAYQFRQRVNGTSTWGSWTTISNSDADTTSHTVSGLTGGTAYDFQIRPRVDLVLGTASDTVSATPSDFAVSVVAADLVESESTGTRSGVFRVNVTPSRSVAVALRFCFESSFTTPSFAVAVAGSQVSLDSNGCVDRTGSGGSVNQITFTVNGTNDSVDEPDEVVTVTVLEDPDNTLPVGVVIDSDNDEASIKIRDDDATVVSLARVGSGAIREGATAEFTVSLGRALVAGETVDVPLAVGGTNVGVADWSLALKTGQSINTGVTLSDETTVTPKVSFSGAAAQTATLVLSALIDDDTSVETFTVALGPDGTGANGFDVATLATNVGGGADPHASNKTFDLTVNNPSPAAAPSGLTAVAGNTQVTLSWDDPSNSDIASYEYRQGTGDTVSWNNWTAIPNSDADTTSHTVTGLTNGTQYSFQIRAVWSGVKGTASTTVTATPVGFAVSVVAADLVESESSGTRSGVFRVSVSPSRSVAVALRFCFESSFTTPSFAVAVAGSQVSLDSNGCVDRTGSGGSVNQITFTVNGTNDSVDEPDEVVTVTVLEDPDNPLPVGVVIDSDNDEASIKIRDDDATVVSLARVGSGAIREGATAEFTVSLGRALVAGETVDVPLAVGGTNVGVADWSLALKTGQSINTGVTLSDETTVTPKVSFSGAAAQTATLVLSALIDDDTSVETFTVALGPDGTGANGFDVATLATNVGGGADPHASNKTFDLTVNNPSPAAAPSGLTAVAGNTQVTLSWDDPSNSDIASYEYRQGTGDTVSWNNWTAIPNSDADTTSHTVTGLTNGTQYSFQIRAVWSGVKGTASTTVTATPVGFAVSVVAADLVESESSGTRSGVFRVSVSPSRSVAVALRFCFESSFTTPSFAVAVAGSQVSLDSNGCVDRTGSGGSVNQITFTVNGTNDSVDEPDEVVTVTVLEDPDNPLPVGVVVDGDNDEASIKIRDDDATVVSLVRVGSGAIGEGATAEFTVSLGRALVAGETVDVPLAVGGTNVGVADWSLALKTGQSINTGVTLSDETTVTPKVSFSGAAAQTATLVLSALIDDDTSVETFTVALGPDGTGANGFDVATLATNVGGGADPHASNKTFDLTVNNPSPAAAPSGLTAVAGNTQVTLSWDDPSNSDIASYEYRQGTGDTVSWNNWTAIPNSDADTTSHTVTGLTNGTQYSFQIRAVWSGVKGTASTTVTATPEVLIAITPVGLKLDAASVVEGELLAIMVERQSVGEAVDVPIRLVIDGVGTVASSPVRISAGKRIAGASLKAPNDRVDEPTGEAWRVELGTLPTVYTPAPTTPDTTPGAPPVYEQLLATQHFIVLDNDPTTVTLAGFENDNNSGDVVEGGSKQFTITLGRGLVAGEILPVPLVFGGTATRNSDYVIVCPDLVLVGVACDSDSLNESDNPQVTFTGPPQGVTATTVTLTLDVAEDDYLETDIATEINNNIRTGTETVHVTLGALDDTSGSGLGGGAVGVNNFSAFNIVDTTDPVNAIPPPTPEDTATPDPEPELAPPVIYTVPISLVADVRRWAAETFNGVAHVTRWQQVLLAFGDTVPGFTGTPITLSEAQIYARQFWSVRWDPVVEALQQLANNPSPQPNTPPPNNPPVDPQPEPVLPRIGVTTHTTDITEGQNAQFTFTAVPAPTTPLTITTNITTTGNYNITASTQTVTIPTTGTATLTLATTDDNTDEPNGTITLTITTNNTYDIDPAAATATINIADNDAPTQNTGTPIINIADHTITEGTSCRTPAPWSCLNLYPVTITLNRPHHQSVWVSFTITKLGDGPGYATPNQDFTARERRSLIIAAGTTTKNIYVNIKNDNTKEPDETFQITLHNPLRGQIGDGQATITIKDNN